MESVKTLDAVMRGRSYERIISDAIKSASGRKMLPNGIILTGAKRNLVVTFDAGGKIETFGQSPKDDGSVQTDYAKSSGQLISMEQLQALSEQMKERAETLGKDKAAGFGKAGELIKKQNQPQILFNPNGNDDR